MKNATLIKTCIIIGFILLIVFGIAGQIMKGRGKGKENKIDGTTSAVRTEINTNVPVATTAERKTEEQSTEDFTIQADLPDDFPQEEPDPEIANDGVINIYFTNTQELDESNFLPLTAWEKLTIQTQRYLNEKEISIEEIQVISETLKKEGDIISFEATFPEIANSHFTITYNLSVRRFSFDAIMPVVVESETETETETVAETETEQPPG